MQAITDNDGTVIKTIGDEVMSTIPNPGVALSVAIQMQSKVREEFSGLSVNLKVHIGIHFGTLLLEKGDVFGDSVNVAARMVHLAAAGEILTTRATVEALAEPSAFNIRKLGGLPVKGKQDKMDVYEILWEAEDGELTSPAQDFQTGYVGSLLLRYGDDEIRVNEQRPVVVLGRDEASDLAVEQKLASRYHARIKYRSGKFILVDQSTNGTFILTDTGQTIKLRREEATLFGTGQISLGQPFSKGPTDLIHFTHKF